MIWPHHIITERFAELVPIAVERDYSLINAASFDVRIGDEYKVQLHDGDQTWSETRSLTQTGYYILDPGELILVSMWEQTQVSADYSMIFKLKSSRAREGFNHADAGWIDPGWNGYLTMELSNTLQYDSLKIQPGLRIGQMIVMGMLEPCGQLYRGRYNHALGVEGAKAGRDVVIST